jgi:hypothetical protein
VSEFDFDVVADLPDLPPRRKPALPEEVRTRTQAETEERTRPVRSPEAGASPINH